MPRTGQAGADDATSHDAAARRCGPCSLCCRLLRVDVLRKLGGTPCIHQRAAGGCAIHARRPGICRAYRCLWLQGGLAEEERPDRLGALLDLVSAGGLPRLEIREARPGAFDASPRLQAIARAYRRTMAVRVRPPPDPWDPDAPFRVLLPDGEEQHVRGERITRLRDGVPIEVQRLPWLERRVRRLVLRLRARRVAGYRGAPAPRDADPGGEPS
jgi:Fe-S-cluster containining protein